MRRCIPLLAAAATAGCGGGKVKTDALDFGAVRSAAWMERKLVTDQGTTHTHDFVLTTAGGWCREARKLYPQLGAAWNDVIDTIAANPTDATAQCEARLGFYQQAADATDKFFKNGLSSVHMALLDPNESPDVPPFEGSYEVVGYDNADRYILASVQRYDTNPYRLYADTADCDNSPVTFESDALAALEDVWDVWTLSEGTADVSKRDEAYRVVLDGALVEGDNAETGAPAGSLFTRATYDHCELTWDGSFPEFW